MSSPTLVFIPGAWHKPSCYRKLTEPLCERHGLRCLSVTLPTTQDDPQAGFGDDYNAARSVILSETVAGRNVIVIAHSYGGMVANSCIKDLTLPPGLDLTAETGGKGYVLALILIASGYTLSGVTFMDPLFGRPPPSWVIDSSTGYAKIVADPAKMFYGDLDAAEAEYWVSQLTNQSLKALFEGREYAYAGWKGVPSWYIGTLEDQGLPVFVQRMGVEMARAQGAEVKHVELRSSHFPFLSMPEDVVDVILEAVRTVNPSTESPRQNEMKGDKLKRVTDPGPTLMAPNTWLRYGAPFLLGRVLGYGILVFSHIKRFWRRQ